ncbi:aspartate kinase [Arachidicoccus ginsenosidivorans]|jgi:aspartate kinase|uniref:Aspartokinase n=1 Tax=Arachidicoccus ginsenosidivorans TaxID=496057 RepID=A0A5B8VMN0_9BACT|nr:aspartate kinase [Arachidicoccus ginsenosidivorans]QEC72589.1 aspartate kinase [Arachidicoccus ginsenosidivorans]
MRVFKFGGASVQDVDHVKHVGKILEQYKGEKNLIIISAIGKTTNALETVAEAFFAGRKEDALRLFGDIRKQHLTLAKYLLVLEFNPCIAQLADFFTEVEWLLHDKPVREFSYYYDQIVSVGELMSTCIISYYLKEYKINNEWLDVRDVLRTDNHFQEGVVDWDFTQKAVQSQLLPLFEKTDIVITQGFIGSTDQCENTTLGREGSDFSAAIFASILEADNLTIWKDVEGIMNADPRRFPEAVYIPQLSYQEVIEMAYYGAQVIHPKTIKPLQNKNIPLHVKCFLDTGLPGTLINQHPAKDLPPILIDKQHQALIHLRTLDFSFIEEKPMSRLYKIFRELKIKPNLIQTGAISLQVAVDDQTDKIERFAIKASEWFDVQLQKDLNLFTIRHYNEGVISKYLLGKEQVLYQQNESNLQVLYK